MTLEDIDCAAHLVLEIVVTVDFMVDLLLYGFFSFRLIAVVQLSSAQKHLLKSRDAHPVIIYQQIVGLVVKFLEQRLEFFYILIRQLKGQLLTHIL